MLLKGIRRMHGSRVEEQGRWTRHILLAVWIWVLVSHPVAGYFLGDTKAVLKDCVDHWTLQNWAAFPVLHKMTVCVDIRLMAPGPWVAFSYFSVHALWPDVGLEGDENILYIWLLKRRHKVNFQLSPKYWHRICLRRNVQGQSFSLEIDGRIVAEKRVISQAVPPSGSLWLGCRPRDPLPGTTAGEVELYLFRIWADLHHPELCEDGTVIGWRSEFWGITSPHARKIDTNLKCDFRWLRHRVRDYRSIKGNKSQGGLADPHTVSVSTRNTTTSNTAEPPTFSTSTGDRTDHFSSDPQSDSSPENETPPTTISQHISNSTNDGALVNITVTPFKTNHHTVVSRTSEPPLVSPTANDSTDHILPNRQSTPIPTNVTPITSESETSSTTVSWHTAFSTNDGKLANTTMMPFTSTDGTTSNPQTGPTPISGTLPTIVTTPPTVSWRTNFSKNDGTVSNTIIRPVMSTHDFTSNNPSELPMVTLSSSHSTDYIPLKNTTVQRSTIVSQHTAFSRKDHTLANTTVLPFTPTRDIPSNPWTDPTPTNVTPPTTVSHQTSVTRNDRTLANTTMMPFTSTHNTTSNSTSKLPMVSPTVNYSTAYIPASTQSKPTSSNETSPTTASQHINDGALGNTPKLFTSIHNTTSNSTSEPPMVSPTVNYSTAYIPASTQSKPTSSNETSPTTASQHIMMGH
ncbi:mucin-3A [Thalassophryne amazonica]|uniref:mucin-3A n=1 Tax=Thalassophryne amazonica TaxID=390379 RepID=UPI001470AA52|nr:mucin-3A [Thalassophryne amazonica]